MLLFIRTIFFLWIGFAYMSGPLLHAASFDCSHAKSGIEQMICSDETLSWQDENMGIIYSALRRMLPENERKALLLEQKAWLNSRENECRLTKGAQSKDKTIVSCISSSISKRLDTLVGKLSGQTIIVNDSPSSGKVCSDLLVTKNIFYDRTNNEVDFFTVGIPDSFSTPVWQSITESISRAKFDFLNTGKATKVYKIDISIATAGTWYHNTWYIVAATSESALEINNGLQEIEVQDLYDREVCENDFCEKMGAMGENGRNINGNDPKGWLYVVSPIGHPYAEYRYAISDTEVVLSEGKTYIISQNKGLPSHPETTIAIYRPKLGGMDLLCYHNTWTSISEKSLSMNILDSHYPCPVLKKVASSCDEANNAEGLVKKDALCASME